MGSAGASGSWEDEAALEVPLGGASTGCLADSSVASRLAPLEELELGLGR